MTPIFIWKTEIKVFLYRKTTWEFWSCGHFSAYFIPQEGLIWGVQKKTPRLCFQKKNKNRTCHISVYGSRDFYFNLLGEVKIRQLLVQKKKPIGCVFIHFNHCHLHIGVGFFRVHTWKTILSDFAWLHLLSYGFWSNK